MLLPDRRLRRHILAALAAVASAAAVLLAQPHQTLAQWAQARGSFTGSEWISGCTAGVAKYEHGVWHPEIADDFAGRYGLTPEQRTCFFGYTGNAAGAHASLSIPALFAVQCLGIVVSPTDGTDVSMVSGLSQALIRTACSTTCDGFAGGVPFDDTCVELGYRSPPPSATPTPVSSSPPLDCSGCVHIGGGHCPAGCITPTPTPTPQPPPVPTATPLPPPSCPSCQSFTAERIPTPVAATLKAGLNALGKKWAPSVAAAKAWLAAHPKFYEPSDASTGRTTQESH